MRLDCFGSILSRNDAQTLISSPDDMLTKFDELASLCDLDGYGGSIPNSHDRELYFSRLENALKAKCLEEVRDSITAPPELRILAEYVGALTGPGMGETKWTYQAIFWTGASPQTEKLSRGPGGTLLMARRMTKPLIRSRSCLSGIVDIGKERCLILMT
ncbi:uncharacterized protein CLUP02_12730 [Colletotrichum lupini]|uniref:Uncharacterized protein n=1 Tax=Colletotrichum lupini TaxID=145971 RepID=A0A9Q8T1M7_9PEZI|nr:uncharacterized protein CLUP02_12730 [Colletotrichum lupini]UQC87228.1 hypothetical protein CLUP02_12730 [Colletotrichum lupini]